MNPLQSFHCRFLDHKSHVYAIVTHRPERVCRIFRDMSFMTVPFHSNTLDTYNVLVATDCKQKATWMCNEIKKVQNVEVEPYELALHDMSYFANSIHIPLVVMLNSYCMIDTHAEEHEIFYTSRVLGEDTDDYE